MACLDHYTCNVTPALFTTTPNSAHSITIYKDGGLSFTSSSAYTGGPNATSTLQVTVASIPSETGSLDLNSGLTNADIRLDNLY
jgi:hypothetical protein